MFTAWDQDKGISGWEAEAIGFFEFQEFGKGRMYLFRTRRHGETDVGRVLKLFCPVFLLVSDSYNLGIVYGHFPKFSEKYSGDIAICRISLKNRHFQWFAELGTVFEYPTEVFMCSKLCFFDEIETQKIEFR
jgi:hypothetical protein